MPRDPGEMPMIQCAKCGRAVWSDHVNKAGNCVLCSPPRVSAEPEPESEEAPAAG